MKLFSKLAIDLGTANTRIWKVGGGLVLDEPTIVAVGTEDRRVLAVGSEAKTMLGKTPEYIEIIKPLEDGVVSDYEVTEAMLKMFFQQVMGPMWFFGPEVMVCVPAGVTQVEQRAVLDAVLAAGARKANVIDGPLAAAIGAKIAVSEPRGSMIVNLGAGSCQVAVMALGGVVVFTGLRMGSGKIDEALVEFFKKKKETVISEQMAERVKIKIGSAIRLKHSEKMEAGGLNTINNLPKTVTVDSEEVYEVILPVVEEILQSIKETLGKTPPELVADIADVGILLCGGGAQLRNFDALIAREIGVAAHVILEPQWGVVKGVAMALENIDVYRKFVR